MDSAITNFMRAGAAAIVATVWAAVAWIAGAGLLFVSVVWASAFGLTGVALCICTVLDDAALPSSPRQSAAAVGPVALNRTG